MINPGNETNATQLATVENNDPNGPIANSETTPVRDAKNPMRAMGLLGVAIGNSLCVVGDK
jgi:hypothetical protein